MGRTEGDCKRGLPRGCGRAVGFFKSTRRGFGDTTVRLKHNLWGNDHGHTALAVTPYVKVPTAEAGIGNGSVEGG